MAVRGKGMAPLDAVEDFQQPTTAPGSAAAEQIGTVATPGAERQQQLPGTDVPPDTPQVIRNKQMFVEFVEAILARDKDDAPLLKMKFSLMLTPEHEEYLPPQIVNAWNIVKEGHCKRYDLKQDEIPPQTIVINLVPDDEEVVDLRVVNAVIEKPSLQAVEESGSRKTKAGIRFTFLAVTARDDDPTEFAIAHDGDGVWLVMSRTQGSLLDE